MSRTGLYHCVESLVDVSRIAAYRDFASHFVVVLTEPRQCCTVAFEQIGFESLDHIGPRIHPEMHYTIVADVVGL